MPKYNLTPGYGTCDCCGATCTTVYPAVVLDGDDMGTRNYCGTCVDSGAAVAHMEELAG